MKRSNTGMQSLNLLPDINEEIFEKAGISKQDRADLLKRIFHKTLQRTQATQLKVFHDKDNGITYSKPLVDHVTQGKAIDQALQLVGLQKQEAPKIIVKAVVKLPDWAVPALPPKSIGPVVTVLAKQITGPSSVKSVKRMSKTA